MKMFAEIAKGTFFFFGFGELLGESDSLLDQRIQARLLRGALLSQPLQFGTHCIEIGGLR